MSLKGKIIWLKATEKQQNFYFVSNVFLWSCFALRILNTDKKIKYFCCYPLGNTLHWCNFLYFWSAVREDSGAGGQSNNLSQNNWKKSRVQECDNWKIIETIPYSEKMESNQICIWGGINTPAIEWFLSNE